MRDVFVLVDQLIIYLLLTALLVLASVRLLRSEVESLRAAKMKPPSYSGRPPLPTDIPLNCPYCGQKLVLVPSDGPTAYYECQKDGLLILPPDGRLKRA